MEINKKLYIKYSNFFTKKKFVDMKNKKNRKFLQKVQKFFLKSCYVEKTPILVFGEHFMFHNLRF